MARAPNGKAEKARELYSSGMKLVEIAAKLGVPAGTVRRWKSTQKWDSEQNERSEKKSERSGKPKKKKEAIAEEVLENTDLTDKQRLFCLWYVKYRNKVKAYQKAYQCSYTNACSHASDLWRKGEIQTEVNRLLAEYRKNIGLDIKDLFQWYLDIARADINDFIKITDTAVMVNRDFDGTLVSEISETQNGIKVKLNDRMKAMGWLDEHIGLADERQRAEINRIKATAEKIRSDMEGDQEIPLEITFKRASEINADKSRDNVSE